MKEFYQDVADYVVQARKFSSDGNAVIVYMHGHGDTGDIAIDVGCGLKFDGPILRSARGNQRHPDAGSNTGGRRLNRDNARKLRDELESRIQGSKVTIGEKFPAWSRRNGVQYHDGTSDESFQLEVNPTLRRNTEDSARIIATAVEAVYR